MRSTVTAAAVAELEALGGITRMAIPDPAIRRVTKSTVVVACIFFLPSVGFSPGPGSSLGMPWPVFFCTWGVMLFAAFVGFIGYFACRSRGEPVSVFYAVCPVLLFGVFLVFLNLRDIVRVLSS